ncbi:hypothetical protein HWV62_13940 [Athelia sp. TMB]|nr:hypothetical protein HWV62_13940 [Athelia sp. TMB]
MSTDLQPGETASYIPYKARLISQHICRKLGEREDKSAPLMVAMQGPQGCGKTTLCSATKNLLERESLAVAILSLDDLYLPFPQLKALAESHPSNKLLAGRGQPGTHDLELGKAVLKSIQSINETRDLVHLPIFDKSLNEGKGDRSQETVVVRPPLDVFIFEGWSMGFAPVEPALLQARYSEAKTAESERPYFMSHSLDSLLTLNNNLGSVAAALYPPFTVFIQIQPSSLEHVFRWRLQQEHRMKSLNGGRGMTDEEIKAFVERYMPGYELWNGGVTEGEHAAAWRGNGYRLVFGKDRDVTRVEEF